MDFTYYHPADEQRDAGRDGMKVPMITGTGYYVSSLNQLTQLLSGLVGRQYMWPVRIEITPDHNCQLPPDWPGYLSSTHCYGCRREDRSYEVTP